MQGYRNNTYADVTVTSAGKEFQIAIAIVWGDTRNDMHWYKQVTDLFYTRPSRTTFI